MKIFKKLLKYAVLCFAVLLIGPFVMLFDDSIRFNQDWRTADRSSTHIAPNPKHSNEAIVQVYVARAFNWRAVFAVHSWIATKRKGSDHYIVHEVLGWNRWYDLPVVVSEPNLPDRSWYGQHPQIIRDVRGEQAERLIEQIDAAVKTYPYPQNYTVWPGPNSNTFISHIGREVPELKLDLPPTAIGKDYLANGSVFSSSPSGSGYQFSIFGLFGILYSQHEGLEFNILGLSIGGDIRRLRLRLPGIGIADL